MSALAAANAWGVTKTSTTSSKAPATSKSSSAGKSAGPASTFKCLTADYYFNSGWTTAAREAYVHVGEDAECAKAGLREVIALDRACDLGHADLDAHRYDDALTAYKSALADAPRARCAITGVANAEPDGFARALTWLSNAVPRIPAVLAGLGLLVLAVFLLLVLLGTLSFRGRRLPLENWFGLRTLLRPRVTLASIADDGVEWSESGVKWKVGPSMTAQIKERLQRFREEALSDQSPDAELDFGSTDESIADLVSSTSGLKTALDTVSELGESTKLVTALLNLVYAALPIKRLTVSGVLDPPIASCASTTLSIESGAQLEAAVTLKRPLAKAPAVTSSDYIQLVDQAAVWVQFEVTRALTGGSVRPEQPESYALVREGLDRHFNRDGVGARVAFEEALSLDSRNWSAAIDLAVTEARLAYDYERAVQVLERALEDIVRRPASRVPAGRAMRDAARGITQTNESAARPELEEANYYRLAYQLSAQHMHAWLAATAPAAAADVGDAAAEPSPAAEGHRAEARALVETVIKDAHVARKILKERARKRWWRRFVPRLTPHEQRLDRFLSGTLLPSAELLRAGTIVSGGGTTPVETTRVREQLTAGDLTYRTAYNLACYEVALAVVASERAPEKSRESTTSRSDSEDSCGQAGAHFDAALAALREALGGAQARRRQELGRWAWRDPALGPLRVSEVSGADGPYGSRFADLLKLYAILSPKHEVEMAEKAKSTAEPEPTEQQAG
jgi:tetratricopeptide (TPR) repeat protein